ncbi:MAG: ABC transporter permease subunit [Bdellovibrionales bacterium]|nr:ABC transporter permease subunit [Bdellovibrionales bacterium]
MHFLSSSFFFGFVFFFSSMGLAKPLVVGSKIFSESYVLAEMVSQLLESQGYEVKRKMGLGGTLIVYEALKAGEVDIYPEYTGTIAEVILKKPELKQYSEVKKAIEKMGFLLFEPLGFSNTYGIAVRSSIAKERSLETISDLVGQSDLRAGFHFEFYNREDGWTNLAKTYGIKFNDVKTLDQTLAYEGLARKKLDVISIYSTDGKVVKYDMKVLEDNKKFFPQYEAAYFTQSKLPEEVKALIAKLSHKIDEEKMIQLNAEVDVDGKPYTEVARRFLIDEGFIQSDAKIASSSRWKQVALKIWKLTLEHMYLVFLSTFAACLVGVPLGILLFRYNRLADPILYLVSLLQTIPSLALLVYMIPWFGVSVKAALMALFLYSLLPILQNTYTGLQSVSPQLIHAAQGIGLYRNEILTSVQLPIAAPIIIAGIRVASVINVGTATIAAFIGSGGLGELIVQGLTLNDLAVMQQGAIPAAALAVVVNIGFSWLEKRLRTS